MQQFSGLLSWRLFTAVNERQDKKLENFCIWLAIYLNCTMKHGIKQTLNL